MKRAYKLPWFDEGKARMSLNSSIDGFIDTCREMAQRIEAIRGESERDLRMFEKVLHASLIETLARAARPLSMGNKERFVSVVEEFGGWPDSNRVSLPHLHALLAKVSDRAFNDARTFAVQELRKWPQGKIQLLRDPPFDRVEAMGPKQKIGQRVLGKIKLEQLQHSHLLYAYRNSLVHELRVPGYSMEPAADDAPYYVSMSTLGGSAGYGKVSGQSWELTYPLRFFRKLSATLLDNLETHFRTSQINPLAQYQFGSHWLPELN